MRSKDFRTLITSAAQQGEPVIPRCPHAGPAECGGCAFQDRAYGDQVDAKAHVLAVIWEDWQQELTADTEWQIPSDTANRKSEHEAGGKTDWQAPPETTNRKSEIVNRKSIEVVPSPDAYAYRTRMDYVATKGRFGLRRRGRFNYIIDLETCHLIPPSAFAAVLAVYRRAVELGLPDYDIRSHQGFLRYLVVRRSPDDELLIAAVTAAAPHDDAMADLAALALAQPGVLGFHWLLNDTLTDISFGAPHRHWGAATLPMRVGKRTLQIGPNTFFQNNVHLLLPLLEDVKSVVSSQYEGSPYRSASTGEALNHSVTTPANDNALHSSVPTTDYVQRTTAPTSVADLYGGVGTIALHLAEGVGRVVTVESVAESAALARQNIADAGAGNVEAMEADVLPFLRDQPAGAFEVIVADPPRTGLGPEVCAELLRLAPRRIVYVSCNPLTQREDADALAPAYRLTSLRGYDMFPHTPHVEALGVFDRVSAGDAA